MGVATKIVFYVVPVVLLIFVVLIFFAQEGIWEDTKDIILGIKEELPNVDAGFGLEELSADEADVPKVHQNSIRKLNATIMEKMLGENKKNCFANYEGFFDLGEQGTTVQLELMGDKTVLRVSGGAGGKQIVTDLRFEIPGMVPCVIAGEPNVAERFYQTFLSREGESYPYYKAVSGIKINYDDGSYFGLEGNHITVDGFGEEPVNDEGDNFQDNGWLFTPDGKHICFFPTNKVMAANDDGIAKNRFTSGIYQSIPNGIKRKELKLC